MATKPQNIQAKNSPAAAPAGNNAGSGGAAAAVATAPDFGVSGTITVTTDTQTTGLHVSNGEYLDYSLTVRGVGPVFGFACGAQRILACPSAACPGNQNQYHWTHPGMASNADGPDTEYNLTMLFVGAPMTYILVVRRMDKDGNPNVLKNIQYFSSTATDTVTDALEVFAI